MGLHADGRDDHHMPEWLFGADEGRAIATDAADDAVGVSVAEKLAHFFVTRSEAASEGCAGRGADNFAQKATPGSRNTEDQTDDRPGSFEEAELDHRFEGDGFGALDAVLQVERTAIADLLDHVGRQEGRGRVSAKLAVLVEPAVHLHLEVLEVRELDGAVRAGLVRHGARVGGSHDVRDDEAGASDGDHLRGDLEHRISPPFARVEFR